MSILSTTHTPAYAHIFTGGEAFQPQIEAKALDLFQKGKVFLFDPITHTDQCHISAYKVATLFAQRQAPIEYLTSSFLINSTTIRERSRITVLSQVNEPKACNNFLSKLLGSKAKDFVINEINEYLRHELDAFLAKDPNDPELLELKAIFQDLAPQGHFTYPKFAGMVLLLKLLQNNPLPFVVKVKIVCPEGIHFRSYFVDRIEHPPQPLQKEGVHTQGEQPVLVVEAFSVLDKPALDVMKARSLCLHTLFQSSTGKKKPTEHQCSLCTPHEAECPTSDTIHHALEALPFQDLILAAASAFTDECQTESRARFFSPESPLKILSKKFEQSLLFAKEQHISISQASSIFMVEHMYADIARYAFSEKRLVDSMPQEALERREVCV